MSREEVLITAAVVAAVSTSALLVLAFVLLARMRTQLSAMRRELDLASIEPQDDPQPVAARYVITEVGEPACPGPVSESEPVPVVVAEPIDGRLFTDIVVRETVVKAQGLVYGPRRTLDPATRNRIRFEMKREIKRARKQRRDDLKAALRDFQARERAAGIVEDEEDAA